MIKEKMTVTIARTRVMMNESPKLDERSLRIVALARSGVGGEKENARRILRQICEKKHLDFDIKVLNKELEEIVKKIDELRSSINEIVKELEDE